jgi:hypothetical protein
LLVDGRILIPKGQNLADPDPEHWIFVRIWFTSILSFCDIHLKLGERKKNMPNYVREKKTCQTLTIMKKEENAEIGS